MKVISWESVLKKTMGGQENLAANFPSGIVQSAWLRRGQLFSDAVGSVIILWIVTRKRSRPAPKTKTRGPCSVAVMASNKLAEEERKKERKKRYQDPSLLSDKSNLTTFVDIFASDFIEERTLRLNSPLYKLFSSVWYGWGTRNPPPSIISFSPTISFDFFVQVDHRQKCHCLLSSTPVDWQFSAFSPIMKSRLAMPRSRDGSP